MTAYRFFTTTDPSQSAQQAKARRQAVLDRVRRQRVAAAKKTVAEYMREGSIIRASELKERYESINRRSG